MALPVSLTPMRNSSAVSLTAVKHTKSEKSSLTGVIDTRKKYLASVNGAANVCFAGVVDTGEQPKYSNISANN
jgi:hypothetical protein